MPQNMKALKWQLMQSKLSENFGKWRPYVELFLGATGGGQKFHGGPQPPSPLPPWNRPWHTQTPHDGIGRAYA